MGLRISGGLDHGGKPDPEASDHLWRREKRLSSSVIGFSRQRLEAASRSISAIPMSGFFLRLR